MCVRGDPTLFYSSVLYCICVDWRDDPSAPVLYASDGRDLLASIVIVRDFAYEL